jgi:hypothetical protein
MFVCPKAFTFALERMTGNLFILRSDVNGLKFNPGVGSAPNQNGIYSGNPAQPLEQRVTQPQLALFTSQDSQCEGISS